MKVYDCYRGEMEQQLQRPLGAGDRIRKEERSEQMNVCCVTEREREVREAERGRETGYRSTMEASGLKPDETEGG